MQPKVSVIIPVYNVEKYLRQCLDSVVNQTLKDIEIICIDDGSTDNSLNILKEYAQKDNRIKIISKKNGGLSSARNAGLKFATGEFVGFVDSDDYIERETYENAYEIVYKYNVDIVNWGANIIAEDNNYDTQMVKDAQKYHKIKLIGLFNWSYELYNYTTVTVWNKIFRLNLIKQYDISFPEKLLHEDHEFITKYILHSSKVYYINQYYYNYIQRKNSIMGQQFYNEKANNRLDMIDIFQNIYVYYKRFNALDANSNLLSIIFDNAITSAYTKSYDKKFAIKKIKKLALILDNNIMKNHNLELIKKNKINKLSFINSNTFLEKIFSVKNKDIRKQITLLGVKFKIKNKKLIEKKRIESIENKIDHIMARDVANIDDLYSYIDFINTKTKENSILVVEPNDCHNEVLAGIIPYFLQLGYNIDVLHTKQESILHPFSKFHNDKIRIFVLNKETMRLILNSNFVAENYDYIYINSDRVYWEKCSSLEYFDNIKLPQEKILQMCHRLEMVDKNIFKNINLLQLSDLPITDDLPFLTVNAHLFTDQKNIKQKNDMTNFIVVGNIENNRRNFNLLIDTVSKLVKNGVTSFIITVVARFGTLDAVPYNIRSFFKFKGRLSYPDMWQEVKTADFLLTLLDPENPEHERYITVGTSGSFQLVYGFLTPCIIAKKFASVHRFNERNSIIYDDNHEFFNAMKSAIEINEFDYQIMQTNLKNTVEEIEFQSFENLKKILRYQKENINEHK